MLSVQPSVSSARAVRPCPQVANPAVNESPTLPATVGTAGDAVPVFLPPVPRMVCLFGACSKHPRTAIEQRAACALQAMATTVVRAVRSTASDLRRNAPMWGPTPHAQLQQQLRCMSVLSRRLHVQRSHSRTPRSSHGGRSLSSRRSSSTTASGVALASRKLTSAPSSSSTCSTPRRPTRARSSRGRAATCNLYRGGTPFHSTQHAFLAVEPCFSKKG